MRISDEQSAYSALAAGPYESMKDERLILR